MGHRRLPPPLYSALFLTFGDGSLILACRSLTVGRQAIGLSRLVFDSRALLGLGPQLHRIDGRLISGLTSAAAGRRGGP